MYHLHTLRHMSYVYQTTRPHPLHIKMELLNDRSVTLSGKENLEIYIRHVSKCV
jgi:hypothetical protein